MEKCLLLFNVNRIYRRYVVIYINCYRTVTSGSF